MAITKWSISVPALISWSPAAFCCPSRHTGTYFAFRIDVSDDAGNSIYEHIVGSEDFEVAVAAYFAACQRWPKVKITLRQVARVVKKNWLWTKRIQVSVDWGGGKKIKQDFWGLPLLQALRPLRTNSNVGSCKSVPLAGSV
jgi:hypothetical protein